MAEHMNPGMAVSEALADAVEKAGASVVTVAARKRFSASGILYAADLVLTADHVVEREEGIRVGLPDGGERGAELVGRDRATDLALLRLDSPAGGAGPAQTSQRAARVGHLAAAVARPGGAIQASLGMITAAGEGGWRGASSPYLMTDAIPYPGFSGGALVDLAGGVLGVASSGLVRGALLVIPTSTAWETARSLLEHGRVRRGFLGIRSQVVEIAAKLREAAGGGETGLLVIAVEAGGPASGGGLMVGDILIGLNGQPVRQHDDLMAGLSGAVPGQAALARVLRGGQIVELSTPVGERER